MKKIFCLLVVLIPARNLFSQTTWAEHIAPILYANCTPCHHTGGIAPFSLMTYADAYAERFGINSHVSDGHMPPWPASSAYRNYVHERVLTLAEKNSIYQWVANGAPRGNMDMAPAQPSYNNGPEISSPDLTLTIPQYTVSTNNKDVYRCFPLYTSLPTDKYITAIEVIPGNASIVHHVLVFVDTATIFPQLDANDPGPGYNNLLTGSNSSKGLLGYVPGSQPYYAPVGTGFRLPAGATVIVQVHYPKTANGQSDQTSIRLKLSSTPVREIQVYPFLNNFTSLVNGPFSIPANTTRTFNEQFNLPMDISVLTVWPHMHLVGRTLKSWANKPVTGDTIRWVNIPEWDFHWQLNYILPNITKAPAGSVFKATAFFDNTVNNPDNPSSPPQNVTAGEATTDEMMIVFFSYLSYQNGDENIIVDKRIIKKVATTFCQGQSVNLTTIIGTGYNYQWYKDNNTISGATSSSYNATQSGNYTVSITLGGNSATSDPVTVTVTAPPTATITPAGPTVICNGGNVTLNASTGNGYSYQWYKNGSVINGATSASYVANSAGSYVVEVYNTCYVTSSAVTVTSGSGSASINTSGSTNFCQGGSVILTASSGNSYAWSNNATTQSIAVTTSGTYTVTVTLSGCAATATQSVTVNSNPIPAINASGPTTFCQGGSVTLTASGGSTYQWTGNINTASINATTSGNYTVTVTNTSGCTASSSQSVTVNPLPIAVITPAGATTFCEGGSVVLSASSGAGYGYLWSNNATTQNITVAQNGSYRVTVTNGITGCTSSSSTLAVQVNPLPASGFGFTLNSTTVTFINSSTNGNSYSWDFGDGNTSTQLNPSHTYGVVDTYFVTLIVTNSCGSDTISKNINLSCSTFSVNITASGPVEFCEGESVTLSTPVVTGYDYQWLRDEQAMVNENGNEFQATNSGEYEVVVTDDNNCPGSSNSLVITVYPKPIIPTITQNGNVLNSSLADTYQWYLNNIEINGETNGQITISQSGCYAVEVSDSNGCSAKSDTTCLTYTFVSSPSTSGLSVFPNPTMGMLHFSIENVVFPLQINCADVTGKILISRRVESRDEMYVSLDSLNDGMYIFTVRNGIAGNVSMVRVVKTSW